MKVSCILNFIKCKRYFSKNILFSRSIICPFNSVVRFETSKMKDNFSNELKVMKIPKIDTALLNDYIEKFEMECKEKMKNNGCTITPMSDLKLVEHILNERREIISILNGLKELEMDADTALRELAKSDIEKYNESLADVEEKLVCALLPRSTEDCNDIVLEVNAGVGGQEAMLFAKELFDMYLRFADYKGWQVEIADFIETELGGIRHGSLLISGDSVYQLFKHEAGVHRVQRIPSTEKGGRIHTSTVSVLALPQPTDIQIDLPVKDLRIETKRASGAGGQHVNKTESAIRITHLPTGMSVECQVDRSQIKNKRIALTKLRTLLYQKELDAQVAKTSTTKKSQVRSNFRNEKIRTYNFSQDRITDHRIQGNIHNMKGFLEGNSALENLILRLDTQYRVEKLLEIIKNKV
ncbi:hypothetical protein WA026_003225 [Henosepilachna vigintioctopunctata]|uniref:Prokaryotic-type class I peptide chain release factors domain-containing protein n=1 Tax=Henosepilachna vigintioctopunctata TaxID=420089 RepID=A0AAW1TIN6_9CUCU